MNTPTPDPPTPDLLNRMAEYIRKRETFPNLRDALLAEYDTRQPAPPKDAEPVAYRYRLESVSTWRFATEPMDSFAWAEPVICEPLYTTPAPSADRRDAERLLEEVHQFLFKQFAFDGIDGRSRMPLMLEGLWKRLCAHLAHGYVEKQAIARDAQNARKGEEG